MSEHRVATALRVVVRIVILNSLLAVILLVPVELLFGGWLAPPGLDDLTRFSIPVGVTRHADVSALYDSDRSAQITYSRDRWGLRGTYHSLSDIDVLTVGGSTTDQRYVDDAETWQAVAEHRLRLAGKPMTFANAGVDGQSTVGHLFNFRSWFPLLEGLRPRYVVFFIGINDVLRRPDRASFDMAVNPDAWRFKSALYQLYRTLVGTMVARQGGVTHGRKPVVTRSDFTTVGDLSQPDRDAIAGDVVKQFVDNAAALDRAAKELGATSVFMLQTAFAWRPDLSPPLGLQNIVQVQGRHMNYADVAAIHRAMNQALLAQCATMAAVCLDLPSAIRFDDRDYYDFVHNTPDGAEKIGEYLARELARLSPAANGRPAPASHVGPSITVP